MRTDPRRRDDELFRRVVHRSDVASIDATSPILRSGAAHEGDRVEPEATTPLLALLEGPEATSVPDPDATVEDPSAAARRLAAVEVPPEALPRRVVPLAQYLSALARREDLALLGPSSARAAGAPDRIPAHVWNQTAALLREGLSTRDLEVYATTGTLPDRVDPGTGAVEPGTERLARLQSAAAEGRWTAVNALTFLTGARRATLAAEQLVSGPSEVRSAEDRHLATTLHTTFTSATRGRERRALELSSRADALEARASDARTVGESVDADRWAAEARALRGRAVSSAEAEVAYRRREALAGFDLGSALATHAEVELSVAAADLRAEVSGAEVPVDPPAAIERGRGLLAEARSADRAHRHGDRLLELEGRAHHLDGDHHHLHLERDDLPRAQRDVVVGAYVEARIAEAEILDRRLEARPEPSLERAALHLTRAGLDRELRGIYGAALTSESAALLAEAEVEDLATGLDETRAAIRAEREAAERGDETLDSARDRDDPWFDLRTAGERRRDGEAVADAEFLSEAHRHRAEALELRASRLELRVVRVEEAADRARAGATEAAADAAVLADALDRREPTLFEATSDRYTQLVLDADRRLARAAEDLATAPEAPGEGAVRARLHLGLSAALREDAESDRAVRGEAAIAAERARLDDSRVALGAAEVEIASCPLRERAPLVVEVVESRALLAETEAPLRPGLSALDLDRAAELALTLPEGERARTAERIGVAAITSVVRADQNLEAIVASGDYRPEAADHLLALGRAHLSGSSPVGAEGRRARATLLEIDRAIAAAPQLLERAEAELDAGLRILEAEGRSLNRDAIGAAQARIASFLSGPIWAASSLVVGAAHLCDPDTELEVLDMREVEASWRETALRNELGMARRATEAERSGLRDLGLYVEASVAEGRPLQALAALRILSGDSGSEAYDRAGLELATTLGRDDFARYTRSTLADRPGFASATLTGPLLGLAAAADELPDTSLARLGGGVEEMVLAPEGERLTRAARGLETAVAINLAFEVALGLAVTGGFGAGRAVATAETALDSATMIGRASAALRALRAAHPTVSAALGSAAEATALGGAALGASRLAREAFGDSSGAARLVDSATNFLPIGATGRAADLGLVAGIGLGAAQAAGTSLALPELAEVLEIDSELGTTLLGLGLGALIAGTVAGVSSRRAARNLDEAVEGLRARGLSEAEVPAARRELERFALEHHEGRPTPEELEVLASRIDGLLGRSVGGLGPEPPRTSTPPPPATDAELAQRREAFSAAFPAAGAELAPISPDRWRQIFGDGPVPALAEPLGRIEGFGAFAEAHPAEARRLVLSSTLMPGLGNWIAGQLAAGASLEGSLAALEPHLVRIEEGPLPGYLRIRRGPLSPPNVPELSIRPAGALHDHNGAFHFAAFEGPARSPTRSLLPDLRTVLPSEIRVDGEPLSTLEGVMVFAGHGSDRTISGLGPTEVARRIFDELAQPGGEGIRMVVLDACHQRDFSWTARASNGERVQAELSHLLAEAGLPDVRIFAARSPGPTYGTGVGLTSDGPVWSHGGAQQSTLTAPHFARGRPRFTRLTPTEFSAADHSRLRPGDAALLGVVGAEVALGTGYLIYEAVRRAGDREDE
jgi:hypothetical protein